MTWFPSRFRSSRPPAAGSSAGPGLPIRRAARHLFALLLGCALLPATAPALDQSISISVYQGPIREGDFPANIATARSIVTRAIERGAQFVAFPECFLSGYESRSAVSNGARGLEDSDLQEFIRATSSHEAVVLVGLARRNGAQLFNSVLVIHRGRLLGLFDKIHLTPDDRNVLGFTPGTAVPVFSAHGAKFAVMICADTSYPAGAMAARAQGAEILFTPHYNEIADARADDHRRWVRNCHIGLATQFRMVVARPNVVKNSRSGQVGYGDSFILSPQGEPLAEADLFKTTLISATVTPDMYRSPSVWADSSDTPGWLRRQAAAQLGGFRPARDDADLRSWLENMIVHHRYTPEEVSSALGLTPTEIASEVKRLAIDPRRVPVPGPGEPLRVLPYPGGRHPRLGFFDGAVAPQRETKVSVFAPWDDGGYVVVDVPEAIFSNLGLTYLAHTHIPTLWDKQNLELPPLEWKRTEQGGLESERTLPNGIVFKSVVRPQPDGVRLELSLRNGTTAPLTGLRVQNCVMLGRAHGFENQTIDNKVFATPFAAAKSADSRHWVITGWDRCRRAWGNEWVPCIHADPVFPDCPPGESVTLRGWLSFFEGADVAPELEKLRGALGNAE